MVRWKELGGWRPTDQVFRTADICYSIALVLCFTKLAHFLKARNTELNLKQIP
jgi:hypothetical protein